MTRRPEGKLRTGYTTGACATAAATAACGYLVTGQWQNPVSFVLPRGQRVSFALEDYAAGPGWAQAVVIKDAGDDPDVTHGARVVVTVRPSPNGVRFRAGDGVGQVTRPGLPIPPGEPAINPVPRQMMTDAVTAIAQAAGIAPDFEIEVAIPGGVELAAKTWNPRLGIEGGLSILGTTGIVRPFSCAAWIASIHRGVDVARAGGLTHVCGSTGATSEQAAQARLSLPNHAMLDMGDFAGGMLKYLRQHPVPRVTVAGGFAKLTKLAQGALDLHSGRSQVDMDQLAHWAGRPEVAEMNTAMEALVTCGPALAETVAHHAQEVAQGVLGDQAHADILVFNRQGGLVAQAG